MINSSQINLELYDALQLIPSEENKYFSYIKTEYPSPEKVKIFFTYHGKRKK